MPLFVKIISHSANLKVYIFVTIRKWNVRIFSYYLYVNRLKQRIIILVTTRLTQRIGNEHPSEILQGNLKLEYFHW